MKVIHVDMDAFFASVEQRDRPELRGRPVVVGGSPRGRGVVAAASYEARRFGIRSAMPCAQAYRLCPETVFVPPDMARYKEASRRVFGVFREVTDLVEPLSIDEAYLDVTENLLGEPLAGKVARWIKDRVRDETGLTASAGVAPNKFVAKVASDLRKPDGLVVVPPERVREFVAALPVERLWGVGPSAAARLHGLGIHTAGELREREIGELTSALGRQAVFLAQLAWGEDPRRVETHREPKSRGAETTFERDIRELATLRRTVAELAEEVSGALARMGRTARGVTLKVRYGDFTTITRSATLPEPTGDAEILARTGDHLLRAGTEAGRRPVRLLGLSAHSLVGPGQPVQLRLDPSW